MRASTWTSDSPPSRENSPSCSTCSSLACSDRAHLADLVEEDRALVSRLELAGLRLHGAGEGAALEAEQLGLEQVVRERRAVDLDEWLVAAPRRPAEPARHQLLAGARLATDEHGDVRLGDPRHEIAHGCILPLSPRSSASIACGPPSAACGAGDRRFSAAASAASSSRPSKGRLISVAEGARSSRRGKCCRSEITTIGTCRSRSRRVGEDVERGAAREVEDDRARTGALEATHCLVRADRHGVVAAARQKAAEHVACRHLAFDDEDVIGSLLVRGPHASHVCFSYDLVDRRRHTQQGGCHARRSVSMRSCAAAARACHGGA